MDQAPAITAAAIGLLGVLIGGLITTGANYILAVRREHAEEAKDRRIQIIEVHRAARMIAQELIVAYGAAKGAVDTRSLLHLDIGLKTDAWQKYGSVISPELTLEEWNSVAKGYMVMNHLLALVREFPDKKELSDTEAEKIRDIEKPLNEASNALVPYLRKSDFK